MLIGLCGYPEAGKSETARYLAEEYGFVRANVGDGMKWLLGGFYRGCGLDEVEINRRLHGDLKEEPDPLLNGKTPRYAMQTLGKEWRDLIDPKLFADRWADRVREEDVVADGMRYPEEMVQFKALGGVLVRVERPGKEKGRAVNGHIAETQQLKEDLILLNVGTIYDLHSAIDGLLTRVHHFKHSGVE